MRADAMTNGVLKCQSCKLFNVINIADGKLDVRRRAGQVG